MLVLVGGGIGSLARYLIALWTASVFGPSFPWGTLTVNVTGSFLIGVLATAADDYGLIGSNLRVFLVIGILGGFTTFSSFSLETARLAEGREMIPVATNLVANLVLGLSAVFIGIACARILAR